MKNCVLLINCKNFFCSYFYKRVLLMLFLGKDWKNCALSKNCKKTVKNCFFLVNPYSRYPKNAIFSQIFGFDDWKFLLAFFLFFVISFFCSFFYKRVLLMLFLGKDWENYILLVNCKKFFCSYFYEHVLLALFLGKDWKNCVLLVFKFRLI